MKTTAQQTFWIRQLQTAKTLRATSTGRLVFTKKLFQGVIFQGTYDPTPQTILNKIK